LKTSPEDRRIRERLLASWGRLSARHPVQIVIVCLVVISAASFLAARLKISMRWSDLLPTHDPLAQEFDKIQDDFTGTANTMIVVRGPEGDMKRFADEIVPRLESLNEYVKRVDYKIDEDYLLQHGFMLTKRRDLAKMARIYEDLNLIPLLTHVNDSFEETYIADEEGLSDRERELGAIRTLDGLQYWVETMTRYCRAEGSTSPTVADTAVSRFLIGDPYFVSPDKRMLIIYLQPSFSMMDLEKIMSSTDSVQTVLDRTLESYPTLSAGLTGTVPLARDEMYYSEKDLRKTSLVALALVLLLFMLSFRMVTTPLLAGLNLILSILFVSGIISLFVDSLNIMTSMFAVILIGLGIDFSIHIISLYHERRARGDVAEQAMVYTLTRSGAGIITGGLTTSVAFFTLMISDTRGIREMGLVLGIGILGVMVTTLFLLPALLVLRDRLKGRLPRGKRVSEGARPVPRGTEFGFLGEVGGKIKHWPVATLAAALMLSALMLYLALKVEFDYNYLNSEPKGIPSVTLMDSLEVAFQMSPDFAMITADDLEEVRALTEQAKKIGSVSFVESISEFVPSDDQQGERLPYIQKIRRHLNRPRPLLEITETDLEGVVTQLERLEMNIYELGQMAFIGGQEQVEDKCAEILGDPDDEGGENLILELIGYIGENPRQALMGLNTFQEQYRPVLKERALQMANTSRLSIAALPDEIKGRFLSEEGGRYLITITPKKQVWDFEFLARFDDQMRHISEKITGMPLMFLRLVEYIGEDGKKACLLALVVVFFLLWFDFRRIELALVGMIPLVSGAVWMVGLLSLLGLPLSFVSVMGIPMIIGIGIDDGIHLIHRYRVEGWGETVTVFSSTGRAILLTSLTTMAGFGSLILAKYRGLGSLGALLVLGVAACFLSSILFIPALINLLKGNGAAPEAGDR
jgi:hopanoid biosynthesis associated RND transporter like protein HpnN